MFFYTTKEVDEGVKMNTPGIELPDGTLWPVCIAVRPQFVYLLIYYVELCHQQNNFK